FLFKALSIFKATSNLKEEGRCLRQLGRVYWFFSEFEKALKYFEKSLQISREINDLKEEGLCLNSIAVIHYYLGNYESSIIYYKKALKIAREIGDKRNEAECLNNIRYCYTIYGDYIRALEYSEQALNLAQQMKDKFIELRCLISLGELYRYLGYKLKALNYYFRGLKIAQKIGDKAQEKIIWNNIGHIYLNDKEYKKALKYLEKGLEISNQIGDIRTKMALIHNIGYIYWKLNDYSRALKNALYSLKISQNIKDKYMEGKNLNFLGEIFLNIKNYSKSINYFTKAFNIGQKIKHSELLLESLMGIARFYETKGQFYQALEYYKKAIREIENVRAKLLLSEYKYGFLKSKIEVYNNLINLLGIMHSKFPFKGYDRESFYFSEKARARALLDSLQEAKIDLNKSLSSDFKNQIEEINRKISNIMTELENFEIPEEKRKKLLKELDIAEENYERLMRKVKLQNLRYTNIIYPKTLSSSQIQKALSEKNFNKTLILEYMLDKNEIILWAISSINFSMYLIPKEKDFEKLIINYYNLLAEKDTSLNKVQLYGERLFKILLSPVKEELKKYSNLIIIPDGVLYFLPFETLILQTEKEKKYLIKTHNITYSPSSTVLIHLISKQKIKEQKRKYQLLLVGDPVFPTFPLKSASNKLYQPLFGPFERIPYTDDEIFGISRYFPKRKKVILEENSFTEEMLKSLDLRKFKIIHFATHTLIDEIIPWRSAIIFSLDNNPKEDGFLQLREVYNLKLNADLVVLSGCKTNLGKYIAGEGLVSLTRGFLYAGSSSVMGSLWEVGDLSTAYFMKLFYFYLKKGRR
ncbi:CHAT domain-containing protein, partial [Candidatus Aminicenantes bacterium AH-873-B07]|nr:CHAT domain-containing protein [Candidatus Aminicenantes bacterium AH-873-B07]